LKKQFNEVPHCVIKDAGRTQIAAGTHTVLGLFLTLEDYDKVLQNNKKE
jgi:peptidyl-tRNA hydrolase